MHKSKVIIAYLITSLLLSFLTANTACAKIYGQPTTLLDTLIGRFADCTVSLANDTLTLENVQISRKYKFNKGNLQSISLTDKRHPYQWVVQNKKPDCNIPGLSNKPDSGYIKLDTIAQTAIAPAYLEANIYTKTDGLQIKRTFRLYPDCPAIECIYYFRGTTDKKWTSAETNMGNLKNIETLNNKDRSGQIPIMETIAFSGAHWNIQCIEFKDITDRNNNLVNETQQIAYREPSTSKGNLLFATDAQNDHGIFLLKEAPNAEAQVDYPGYDFISTIGKFQIAGIGIQPSDLKADQWIRAYGFVTGVTYGGQLNKMEALRDYQIQNKNP